MKDLRRQIADVLDTYDAEPGTSETLALADVVLDTITTFLTQWNAGGQFSGALTPAISLLSLEAEIERLRSST